MGTLRGHLMDKGPAEVEYLEFIDWITACAIIHGESTTFFTLLPRRFVALKLSTYLTGLLVCSVVKALSL